MTLFGGTDEILVIDVNGLKQRQPGLSHKFVSPALRIGVVSKSRSQHLLAVLIGSGQKIGALTALCVPPGQNIRRHFGVGVTDVRSIVHIEDRGRNVKGLGHLRYLRLLAEGRHRKLHSMTPSEPWPAPQPPLSISCPHLPFEALALPMTLGQHLLAPHQL